MDYIDVIPKNHINLDQNLMFTKLCKLNLSNETTKTSNKKIKVLRPKQ